MNKDGNLTSSSPGEDKIPSDATTQSDGIGPEEDVISAEVNSSSLSPSEEDTSSPSSKNDSHTLASEDIPTSSLPISESSTQGPHSSEINEEQRENKILEKGEEENQSTLSPHLKNSSLKQATGQSEQESGIEPPSTSTSPSLFPSAIQHSLL